MSATDTRTRSVGTATVQVLAAALLIVAAAVLPWATYKNATADATKSFQGGPFSFVLVFLGVASLVLSFGARNRSSAVLARLHFGVGGAAVVVAIALALSKISAANHFSTFQQGGSQTAYAPGSIVGVVAAAAIALTSVGTER